MCGSVKADETITFTRAAWILRAPRVFLHACYECYTCVYSIVCRTKRDRVDALIFYERLYERARKYMRRTHIRSITPRGPGGRP